MEPDEIAILLFTSGTTGEPKAAVLRHRHLTSYVISTVEFMGADEDEAALVSVPPYHIAGISAITVLGLRVGASSTCRRSTPEALGRDGRGRGDHPRHGRAHHARPRARRDGRNEGERLPALRHLSYGGGRMPVAGHRAGPGLLPHVDFVNAYGLTETSSTIAVLGPDDHRAAIASDDPAVRRRLGSVGRPLPTLEVTIRDTYGRGRTRRARRDLGPRRAGLRRVPRPQADRATAGSRPATAATLDEDGYLFVEGRLDDVIVRGGENISPGEIEDVLATHPPSPTSPSSACPTPSGARRSSPPSS